MTPTLYTDFTDLLIPLIRVIRPPNQSYGVPLHRDEWSWLRCHAERNEVYTARVDLSNGNLQVMAGGGGADSVNYQVSPRGIFNREYAVKALHHLADTVIDHYQQYAVNPEDLNNPTAEKITEGLYRSIANALDRAVEAETSVGVVVKNDLFRDKRIIRFNISESAYLNYSYDIL